jgi:hypothetical protein
MILPFPISTLTSFAGFVAAVAPLPLRGREAATKRLFSRTCRALNSQLLLYSWALLEFVARHVAAKNTPRQNGVLSRSLLRLSSFTARLKSSEIIPAHSRFSRRLKLNVGQGGGRFLATSDAASLIISTY